MAQVQLNLDAETYRRLLAAALAERRPVPWQAEVVLRRALGLPFPCNHLSPSNHQYADPASGASPIVRHDREVLR